MRTCGTCGTPASSPWAKFCMKCGAALPPAEMPVPSVAPAVVATGAPAVQYVALPQQRNAGSATAALIFGILAFFMYFLGFLLAPTAIVLGVVGRHKVDDDPVSFRGRGMATAGVVLGFCYMILATAVVSGLVFTRVAQLR